MERVDEETVRRVAARAGLAPAPEDRARYARELGEILSHVRRLPPREGEPDAGEAAPAPSPDLRPDVPGPDAMSRPPADLAPDWRDGFFVVPRPASLRGAGEGEGKGKG